jgi:hypothetical protein
MYVHPPYKSEIDTRRNEREKKLLWAECVFDEGPNDDIVEDKYR